MEKSEAHSDKKSHKEKSWHFDAELPSLEEENKDYVIVAASHKDKQKVTDFYQHHPVAGYEVASVEVIYNPDLNRQFAIQMKLLQQRDKNKVFAPKWGEEMEDAHLKTWRKKVHTLFEEMAKPYVDEDYPAVKLVPMWHGTRDSILDSLFRTGYANLAKTDPGFYGKGVYSAYEADYSYRVYGKGALIMNWCAVFSAYPVIGDDMDRLKLYEGKANYSNYDAHFIPVVPKSPHNPNEKDYIPTQPNQRHTYTELVVFQSAACLPRYLVKLQKALQKPLSSNPQPAGGTITTTTTATTTTITTTTTSSTTASTSTSVSTGSGGDVRERDWDYRMGRKCLSSGNYQKAVEYFEQSAEKKYPPADLVLGFLYQAQFTDLIGKDEPQKSVEYYRKATSHLEWFQQEANAGLADAQTALGFCYLHGIGVTQDKKEAVKYYQLAAEQGEISAMNNLALCYEQGNGVEKNLKKAAALYQRSADAKDINAQLNFALCCKQGDGVPQDDQKAFQYFMLAADQGDAVAQYHTAVCFKDGQGTPQNLPQAVKYFERSANQHYQEAKNALSLLVQLHPELKASVENANLLSLFFSSPKGSKLSKDKAMHSKNTSNHDQKCVLQ